jgi:hypothetical protein
MTEQDLCYICNESVDLRTSVTDERGRPAHEKCYASLVGKDLDWSFPEIKKRPLGSSG